jgi:hypothetical protein
MRPSSPTARYPRSLLPLLRAAALLLGLALLFVGYYWVHKPLTDLGFVRAGGILLDLATAALLFVLCGGIGQALLARAAGRLPLTALSPLERAALAGGVGLCLASTWALLAGHSTLAWARTLLGAARTALPRTPFEALLVGIAVLLLGLAAIHAAAPRYEWDSLVYHLTVPQTALREGRLLADANNFYAGFPKLVEMLYGIAMSAFGRATAAAPVHYGFGLLGLLAAAGLAHRVSGARAAGLLAAALLLGSYNLWELLGWTYVDLAATLYVLLAFILVVAAFAPDAPASQPLLALAGACIGAGVGAKYTAGLFAIALVVCVGAAAWRRGGGRGALLGMALLTGAALLAYAPWALHGLLLYGNPIYPYVFGGLAWSEARMAAFNHTGLGLLASGNGWMVLAAPITATVFGTDNGTTYQFTLGPLLLTTPLALPLVWGVLHPAERRFAAWGGAVLALIYALWGPLALTQGIGAQPRLVLGILPLSAALGGLFLAGLLRLPEKPVHIAFLFKAAVAFALLLAGVEVMNKAVFLRLPEYATGQIAEQEWLFNRLVTHPDVLADLGALPAGSQVRMLWEPRGFYCPAHITCVADVLYDYWQGPLEAGRAPAEVLAAWRAAGDQYVLYFRLGEQIFIGPAYQPQPDETFAAAGAPLLQPVWTTPDDRYTLYTWPDTAGAP